MQFKAKVEKKELGQHMKEKYNMKQDVLITWHSSGTNLVPLHPSNIVVNISFQDLTFTSISQIRGNYP